jgi:hypothetical protein
MRPDKASILWRRLDRPGHDSARLTERPSGAILEGTAVFREDGRPCRLDYRIQCDAAWRTLSAHVCGWLDTTVIDVVITADAARAWTVNGRPCPEVQGCEDVDLSFTPATNLLPIRRTGLAVGARATMKACGDVRAPADRRVEAWTPGRTGTRFTARSCRTRSAGSRPSLERRWSSSDALFPT